MRTYPARVLYLLRAVEVGPKVAFEVDVLILLRQRRVPHANLGQTDRQISAIKRKATLAGLSDLRF
jgi:hypothetical protein